MKTKQKEPTKNEVEQIAYVLGFSRAYFSLVLSSTDDESAINDGFAELMGNIASLGIDQLKIFSFFEVGIDSGLINLTHIDKLMLSLINHDHPKETISWLSENFELMRKEIENA